MTQLSQNFFWIFCSKVNFFNREIFWISNDKKLKKKYQKMTRNESRCFNYLTKPKRNLPQRSHIDIRKKNMWWHIQFSFFLHIHEDHSTKFYETFSQTKKFYKTNKKVL